MFSSSSRIYSFLLVWAAIMAVHTLFINLTFDYSLGISITDAFVFNSLFALLAFGLWYFTAFYDIEKRKIADLIINHLTASIVSVLVWVSLSIYLLKHIFSGIAGYNTFLELSVPFRAVVGLLFYAMSVWVFYLIRTLEKAKWQAQQQEKITSLLKDAELKALRSQVNPHFLFNSLNSIHSLTMSDPGKAGEMILKLSDLMRYSLSKQEQMVKFSEEISQVSRYLDIEKVRFSERLSVIFDIMENTGDVKVPSMILQPLLENAVKYGIYGVEKGVVIKLSAKVSENMLEVIISNNYDPLVPVSHGTGMGLNNVRERLSVVFYRNDLVTIEKTSNLFTVKLRIPIV
jgi:two-component system, LytTR family, sensor kinase